MALRPLVLHAEPDAWRLYTLRKADSAFLPFQEKVLERDQYTCQYCGFHSQRCQEVVNVNHDYHDNDIENLITACYLCTQCHFLEMVGVAGEGGGVLIYLPEMDQAQLNALCHVLFCAINNATTYRADAQAIYRELKLRAQLVEEEFGEQMSDPAIFGRVVIDSHIPDSQEVGLRMLGPIRLLPLREGFKKQMSTLASMTLMDLASR